MIRPLILFVALLLLQLSVPAQSAWQAGTAYAVNDLVSYQSTAYKCLQHHTSQVGWEPPNAPSLWQTQGGGTGSALFTDDFEIDRGWTTNAGSADTAGAGAWQRGTPVPTAFMGAKQIPSHGGTNSLATGLAGGKAGANDVDGGVTTIRSPEVTVPADVHAVLSFWYYFAHDQRSSADDYFAVKIIAGGGQAVVFQKNGRHSIQNAEWRHESVDLSNFAGQTVRIQFEAADLASDNIVEAGVDDIEVSATAGGAVPGNGFPARFFSPYVDVLLYPPVSLPQTLKQSGVKYFTLAFVTAGSGCQADWGGIIPMSDNYLIADVNALRALGGDVIVSFGGASGIELAQACTSVETLQREYQAVIDKYNLTGIDFDVEGGAVSDAAANDRRNKAIAALQAYARAHNRELKVSFTLPVLPSGLEPSGTALLQNALLNSVEISAVNIMAMDYGAIADPNQMGQNAVSAANGVISQLATLYPGKTLPQRQAMMGITPMIGLNDVAPEIFTTADAATLLSYAQSNNISRLGMWSVTRDKQCPAAPAVSPTCSGINQQPFDFSVIFRQLH
jgi:Glycosyl hydrolases family 18